MIRRRRSADLQDFSLYVFEGFGLDAARDDASQAQKPKHNLHLSTLRDQLLDGRNLIVHVV